MKTDGCVGGGSGREAEEGVISFRRIAAVLTSVWRRIDGVQRKGRPKASEPECYGKCQSYCFEMVQWIHRNDSFLFPPLRSFCNCGSGGGRRT